MDKNKPVKPNSKFIEKQKNKMKITTIHIRIILIITFISVGLVTFAQEKATYQVAYSDSIITPIEGGLDVSARTC